MSDHNEPEPEFDAFEPTIARVYDYGAGGKDNYAADRAVAGEILELSPEAKDTAALNRAFIRRALRHVARNGVRQLIDIGAGIPDLKGSPLQIMLAANANARVAYVDKDTHVLTHLRAYHEAEPCSVAIWGDLGKPRDIMTHPRLTGCIDLAQPVAVLLGAVLHFQPNPGAFEVTDFIKSGLAPGSYLIVSHATGEGVEPGIAEQVQDKYAAAGMDPLTLRTRGDVARFFEGWDLAAPGVADINDWHPLPGEKPQAPTILYGGVARKSP